MPFEAIFEPPEDISDGIDINKLRSGEPISIFFANDPQVDTLMRSGLINGFNVRVGGRVAEDEMFPYLDMMLQEMVTGDPSEHADARLLEVVRGSSQSQEKLIEAAHEHRREVEMFKRNRMRHPYNLFRDFEEDPISHVLVHSTRNAVSFQVQSMAELDTALDDWEDGTLSQKMAEVFLHTPMYAVLLLGSWNPDGVPSGLVLVVCQLAAKKETMLDKYLHPRNDTMKLVHLGPEGNIENDDAFFEDLSLLQNTPSRDYKAAGRPAISKLRFWQGVAQKNKGHAHRGAIVLGLQAWYGQTQSLTGGMHGSRSGAQFFVDMLFEQGEYIREISGYFHFGEYGHIQVTTSADIVHTVGLRHSGHFFKIEVPGQDGYEATSFVGETSPTGELRTLKLILCKAEHFYTPPGLYDVINLGDDQSPALTAQGSRRRVLPEADGDGGGRASAASRLSTSGSTALGESGHRKTVSGSTSTEAARQRPWSTQSRKSKQVWDGDGAEGGGALKARPQSATQRRPATAASREEASPAQMGSGSSPLQQGALARTAPDPLRELEAQGSPSGTSGWRRQVAEAVQSGSITAQTRLMVQVEYCTAERPSRSLRGSAQQYVQVVADFTEKCKSILWEYNVRVLGNSKFEKWRSERDLSTTPVKARIGACEVQLSWQHRLATQTVPLHSKLSKGKWPNVDQICQDLCSLLPAQYHDIRFMAQSASDAIVPNNVKVTITRTHGVDPLGLIGSESVAYTDEDGIAAVSLPAGTYHVRMEHPLLETTNMEYKVEDPANGTCRPFQRMVMQPQLREDQISISLAWSMQPTDLDLYVITPTSKVSHSRKTDAHVKCALDVDIRTGYGPETVTLQRPSPEEFEALEQLGAGTTLHVFVHQYSEDGDLADSEAEIRLLTGVGVSHVAKVPQEGVGQYWDAFSVDLKTMQVEERHVISAQEPSFDVMLDGKGLVKSDGPELGKASSKNKDRGIAMLMSSQRRKSSKILVDFEGHSGVRP